MVQSLGQGGMGAVFLLSHNETQEKTAIKVLLKNDNIDSGGLKLFLREIQNYAALDHDNIVQIRNSGALGNDYFILMEYCDGGSLDFYHQSRGTMNVEEAVPVALDILSGLSYAHEEAQVEVTLESGSSQIATGIVHRDLKPGNVFLQKTGDTFVSKVADFGLAKAFETAGLSGVTVTGSFGGTPGFMPRLQLIEYKYAQPEVDVWAAAACLYNMLTYSVPRDFIPGRDVWQTVAESPVVPVQQRRPDIPEDLAQILDRVLDDSDQLYYQTARQLSDDLRRTQPVD